MKSLLSLCLLMTATSVVSGIMSSGVSWSARHEMLKDIRLGERIAKRNAKMIDTTNLNKELGSLKKRSQFSGHIKKRQTPCGQIFTEEEEPISSPNYPNEYPDLLDCEMTIEAPQGYTMQLIFDDFRIEIPRSHNNVCEFDALEIRQESANTEPIAVVCGKTKPSPITVNSNKAILRMFSDGSLGFRGFRLHAHFLGSATTTVQPNIAPCGSEVSVEGTVIQSPNYPNEYPNNYACIWEIVAPPGKVIQLSFAEFELEPENGCSFDSLTIRQASSEQKFCDVDLSTTVPFVSDSGRLTLEFSSDGSLGYSGFSLTVSFLISDDSTETSQGSPECSSLLIDPEGSIVSPRYPSEYPNNFDCSWTVDAPFGNTIQLSINDFHLEDVSSDTGECAYDRLIITAGDDINTLCGDLPSDVINIPTNSVTLRMVTDGSVSYSGFDISYRFVDNDAGTVLGLTGGPLTLDQLLTIGGETCTYTISATPACNGAVIF